MLVENSREQSGCDCTQGASIYNRTVLWLENLSSKLSPQKTIEDALYPLL